MDFSIVWDTAGAKIADLADDLMELLEYEINDYYENIKVSIGIAIRCLPNSYNRKSFTRYTKSDNFLTIDFCLSLEDYEKMYEIEQKFELGKLFIEWLNKGLSGKNFIINNPNFDKEDFIKKIKELGKNKEWFEEEIDYSK